MKNRINELPPVVVRDDDDDGSGPDSDDYSEDSNP